MEPDLDENMSAETKEFIRNMFKVARPGDILKADINLVRKLKDQTALSLNEFIKFDDVNITDITVKNKTDNFDIIVRKYIPKNSAPDSPITIFIHGGGYTIGSRITHHHSVGFLSRTTNSIWLSVEYRRCPDEAKYPTPYLDCKSVVEWTLANKENLGSEKSKIGLCGDSSGGQFAAILAHEFKNSIDYQILIYPSVTFSYMFESAQKFTKDCYILTPEVLKFYVMNLDDDPFEHDAHLSPIFYKDFSNLAKCLIIAAELDPLVDHSIHYHKKLIENQIDSTLTVINGTVHGFFSQPLAFKQAFEQIETLIKEFFKKI